MSDWFEELRRDAEESAEDDKYGEGLDIDYLRDLEKYK